MVLNEDYSYYILYFKLSVFLYTATLQHFTICTWFYYRYHMTMKIKYLKRCVILTYCA